ncbi:polysaccharide deacetylase family protein [Robertkochia marina]|uniref:Polysaccharide deacetylase family protein n=1 Tax=Robertkochia marina TaxID=1227945 RepID=A0A4S3M1T5_9FLAO|nr:polysaccharide deacetylase family protein [Robertkochia marina]THD69016.1 polysaccharide deacetylase family protein [Robertkochia marina]TRZ44839.1 polysaccharide deacetylase family protein [Robertkochia marina]
MKPYLFKTPGIVKWFAPQLLWRGDTDSNKVYLTFDDGPTPEITTYVLNVLEQYRARATFFCIGKNIEMHPDIFKEVLQRGHSIGNHTYDHLNASEHKAATYLNSIQKTTAIIRQFEEASGFFENPLFRPPYGRINRRISKAVRTENYRIVMWSLLSADFDRKLDRELSIRKLKKHTRPGSIVVFHDSVKAFENLKNILPEYLDYLKKEGMEMCSL